MLTLNVSGKSKDESLNILREAVAGEDTELKILIDDPAQASELQKFLEAENFKDILPEDDDGTLYLTAARKTEQEIQAEREAAKTAAKKKSVVKSEPGEFGVILSREARKHEYEVLERFTASLLEAEAKPEVLCLMNGAVKLAAYNSSSCDVLKRLEAAGVRVLVSSSCADRLGVTEAVGAGTLVSLSEIVDAAGSCGKLLSI